MSRGDPTEAFARSKDCLSYYDKGTSVCRSIEIKKGPKTSFVL